MTGPKRTSDEAVKRATGKTWQEWFSILDVAGSVHREHKEIARWLQATQGVPPWWSQMVTVEYERARGLRQVYETATGFEVSVHRTLEVPIHDVYVAWADEKQRVEWLLPRRDHPTLLHPEGANPNHPPGDPGSGGGAAQAELVQSMQLTSTRPNKILHFKLADGSKLDVATDPSPSGKARLGIEHSKLKSPSDVEDWRTFWKAALDRLAERVRS